MIDPAEGFTQFVAVVEEGSISAAARAHDLPRPTLSRRIAELEASLGVKLLHRSTRRLVLTEAGHELYRRTRRIIQDAEEAREAVRRLDGVPRGTLRLAVPPSMGKTLEPVLTDYMTRFQDVQVEVLSGTRFVDLVSEGVDVAVRAGPVDDANLRVLELNQTDVFPVASPTYLERHGVPTTPRALSRHSCLVDYERGDVPRRYWPLKEGGKIPIQGRLTSNDLGVLLAMALKDWGITLLPEVVTEESLAKGELVPVLREQVGNRTPVSLVHTSNEFVPPKVRAFLEIAVPYLKAE